MYWARACQYVLEVLQATHPNAAIWATKHRRGDANDAPRDTHHDDSIIAICQHAMTMQIDNKAEPYLRNCVRNSRCFQTAYERPLHISILLTTISASTTWLKLKYSSQEERTPAKRMQEGARCELADLQNHLPTCRSLCKSVNSNAG